MIWKQQLLSVLILSPQHCSQPLFSKHLKLYDTPHKQVTDSKSKTLNGNLQVLTSPTFNHISRRSHVIPRVRTILSHHNLHKNNNTTRPAIPWSQNADAWMAGKRLQKQHLTLMLVHEALQDPTNSSNISSASIQVLVLDQAYTSKYKVLHGHGRYTFMRMQGSSCMCKISPSYGWTFQYQQKNKNREKELTSRCLHPERWGPCRPRERSWCRPWFYSTRSRWSWSHRSQTQPPTRYCLEKHTHTNRHTHEHTHAHTHTHTHTRTQNIQ